MYAPLKNIVRLESTIKTAIETRDTLFRVHDLLPEGIDRNKILSLAHQLHLAIENVSEGNQS
jgi:hypothetical protein